MTYLQNIFNINLLLNMLKASMKIFLLNDECYSNMGNGWYISYFCISYVAL